MHVYETVGAIREELERRGLPGTKKSLWATMLTEIAKSDSFNGHYVGEIEKAIRALLDSLDDEAIIRLWLETENGMSEDDPESRVADWLRFELIDGMLDEATKEAWRDARPSETKKKPKK